MAERTDALRIEQSFPRERLDQYLRSQLPAVSRATLQRLITEGRILVNGQMVKPTHHPKAGELVEITWPEPRSLEVEAQELPLDILFEDKDLLVLNKPPGMVVHPSAGHDSQTLVNALLHHCGADLSGIGGVMRPGIVHRLDRDTSGCLVVAKNDRAHQALSAQFAERSVEKIYHAIVCGELRRSTGKIDLAIARHPSHRKRMAVTHGPGREARTTYRVIARLRNATLLEARLHTGRTHQIRVHFLALGHPLAGDQLYGKRQNQRLKQLTGIEPPRQMLHAFQLSFKHPSTGKPMTFRADWPEDFHSMIDQLKLN